MANLENLLERVKAATGPDGPTLRYVDCHLWVLSQGGDARMHVCDSSTQDFIWERGIDGFWVRSVVKFRAVPKYTASVDAALALVERLLPGWSWKIVGEPAAAFQNCAVLRDAGKLSDVAQAFVASHRTPALAILTALLSALIAKENTHD